jgi:hypothetical protein
METQDATVIPCVTLAAEQINALQQVMEEHLEAQLVALAQDLFQEHLEQIFMLAEDLMVKT